MIRIYRIALIGCVAPALLAAAEPAATALLAQMPLRFEANQGQFDRKVRFAARTSSYSLALTAQGAVLRFPGLQPVSLSLPGSAASPVMEPLEMQSVRTDYLIGAPRNWHTGVANYSRVRYRSIYPGVDMVFYGKENQLEYDFVLQPGAKPEAIRMQFGGVGPVRVTADGDLSLETPGGLILQRSPVIYQQDRKSGVRRRVSGKYVLMAGNTVAVHLGSYDRTKPLVIDPTLTYSTLIGGSGTDIVGTIKVRNGLVYISGATQTGTLASTDMPYFSLTDCYLEIIDITAAGGPKLKYFTYLGGGGLDNALGMDIDAAGFVYLVGATSSTDFPIVGAAIQTTGATSTGDGFLAKLDPNQAGNGHSLVYSTYIGGTIGDDIVRSVAVGANGIAYLVGSTQSPDFPITDNAYAASLYGPSDCFLAQIDTLNGVLLYSSFFGSELDDDARAVVLAPNGLVYFAGTTSGTQFPVAGPSFNPFPVGNYDVVLGAFDLTKSGVDSLVYGTYFGGSANDEVRGMALDAQGRVLITGYTLSTDFPITASTAVQPVYSGNGDAFVSLVDMTQPSFNFLVYSTFLGGSDGDVGYGVTADAGGYLYATGYTLSSDFPITGNAPQTNWGGGIDMFIARINPARAGTAGLDYSTYIGLDSTIVGCCLDLGSDGSLYVGGSTEGYLPLIGNPIQVNYGGGFSDGFLLVLSPGPGAVVSQPQTVRVDPRKGVLTNGIPGRVGRR
jgi:hypothetical protein